jgi:hypothetical protein
VQQLHRRNDAGFSTQRNLDNVGLRRVGSCIVSCFEAAVIVVCPTGHCGSTCPLAGCRHRALAEATFPCRRWTSTPCRVWFVMCRATTALLEARRRDKQCVLHLLASRVCLDQRPLAVSRAHPVPTAVAALALLHVVPVVPVATASAPLSTTAAADRAMQGMRAVPDRHRQTTAAPHALLARGAAAVLAPVSCATPAASATSPRRCRLAAPATATLHLDSDALQAHCRALA